MLGEIVAAAGKAIAIGANVALGSEVGTMFDEVRRALAASMCSGIYNYAPLEAITRYITGETLRVSGDAGIQIRVGINKFSICRFQTLMRALISR